MTQNGPAPKKMVPRLKKWPIHSTSVFHRTDSRTVKKKWFSSKTSEVSTVPSRTLDGSDEERYRRRSHLLLRRVVHRGYFLRRVYMCPPLYPGFILSLRRIHGHAHASRRTTRNIVHSMQRGVVRSRASEAGLINVRIGYRDREREAENRGGPLTGKSRFVYACAVCTYTIRPVRVGRTRRR